VDRFIRDHYADRNLALATMAEEFELSASYVGRLYRRISQRSIPAAITDVRIMEAKRLLEEDRYSVEQIAERVGFSSASYFFKVFKKHNGYTPSYYRNKIVPQARPDELD
jgi:two-component system, response regulator YesN